MVVGLDRGICAPRRRGLKFSCSDFESTDRFRDLRNLKTTVSIGTNVPALGMKQPVCFNYYSLDIDLLPVPTNATQCINTSLTLND
jgi:hypothetical protein